MTPPRGLAHWVSICGSDYTSTRWSWCQ